MGNIVSDDDGNLNTNTQLGKFIDKWARENYTVHPSFNQTQQLKKRACCTLNSNIPIGLPGFDLNKNDTDYINKVKTAPFVPEYAVGIKVFNEKNEMNTTTCKIDGRDYLATLTGVGSVPYTSEGACVDFYDKNDTGFCNKVIENRKQYINVPIKENDQVQALYGPLLELGYNTNPEEKIQVNKRMTNTYIDCNCKNSYFEYLPDAVPTNPKTGRKLAPAYDLSQNQDLRCADQKYKTWKQNASTIAKSSYVSVKTGNITVTDGGVLSITAIANVIDNEPVPTTPAPTTPAPTKPVPTTPAPTKPVPTTPAPTTSSPTTPAPKTPSTTISSNKSTSINITSPPTPTQTQTPTPTTPRTPTITSPAPAAGMSGVEIVAIVLGILIFLFLVGPKIWSFISNDSTDGTPGSNGSTDGYQPLNT